ncbi:aldehyde dehydrogenase family protein [Halorarum halobium]|uniref:2,5-dioxovalerate dehydrogenase n=1 Tax=Halorarum halobium TaxID=3075121 RepID=UPI0028A96E5F|nr:aldehyde dehydrogenase family protein [Halobaculum sp. XH14]
MPERDGNFIDGAWTQAESGETFEVVNPARTDEVVSTFPLSDESDAARAVEAARAAADDWANTPGPARGKILREAGSLLEDRREDLVQLLTREEGKTHDEARPEVVRTVDIFYHYAEKAADYGGTVKAANSSRKTLHTRKEPLGVAALITPWNYPIAIPAWKLAPALAAGNTVVIKPATQAPTVAAEVVGALEEAGLPDGVVNLVTGPGSAVGEAFTTHPEVDAVSFTGSGVVGTEVYRGATAEGKRAQAEMGGKNPTVVMPSADLDEAVSIVGAGAFGVTGQACTACSRAIVHADVYDEFVAGIVDYAESLSVGAGDEGNDMGPQISEGELEGTLDYVDVAKTEGATLATGGERLEDGEHADGFFVEPTVFADVDNDSRLAQEEVFGPVLAVIRAEDFEEAVTAANDTRYGLSTSIVTDSHAEANEFVDRAEAGVVKVNEKTTGLELHVPFGGVKESSTNTFREQGDAGLDFFTTTKTVYRNY